MDVVRQIDRPIIGAQVVDLNVRHAQAFDDVFDSLVVFECIREKRCSATFWEENRSILHRR